MSDDGETWLGTAALLRAPAPATARTVLASGPDADIHADLCAGIEVLSWQFGGRS